MTAMVKRYSLVVKRLSLQEVTINVYENNYSVFVYRIDVDISARSTNVYYRTISITNTSNTVIINLFNRKEELVTNERTNIDLSMYNEKLIIGVISSEYNSLSYLDNLLLTNSTIQTKIVPVDVEKVDYGFMAVRVPGNTKSDIVFRYRTPGLDLGVKISLCALAAFAVYMLTVLTVFIVKKIRRSGRSNVRDNWRDI